MRTRDPSAPAQSPKTYEKIRGATIDASEWIENLGVSVARKTEGGPALAVISVDQRVGSGLLTALREVDDVIEARAVHFSG